MYKPPKATDEILNAAKEILQRASSYDNHHLWWILTALRGPDHESIVGLDGTHISAIALKRATTAVIRYALGYRGFADSNADYPELVEIRNNIPLSSLGHFAFHSKQAFEALGLSWNTLNSNSKI